MSFVLGLESSIDGSQHPHDRPQGLHAGRPLLVRYDLEAVGAAVTRDELTQRESSPWRYRELLPIEDWEAMPHLEESMTPLVHCRRLGEELGLKRLLIKDESRLPTGSFKARGLAMAVARAKELGLTRLALPTAGNAGGALAAYCARAGLESFVLMPIDTPAVNRDEARLLGAQCVLVDGLIDDCGALVAAGAESMGWFDCSTLKEPYRIEGKKTMGLELAEQLGWTLPDHFLYPTGGGTGLIGCWKAFDELETLGWLDDTSRPKMVACQAAGCAPIPTAFEADERHAERFENAATVASGLRVPKAVGDFLILDAVRASGGSARTATDERLLEWTWRASALEGLSICPETGCCLAVLDDLCRQGAIGADDTVVVINTGAAQKYAEVLGAELNLPLLHPGDEPNWPQLFDPC
ncbi:MAG: threonine synthase [Acidobacteriota bacterium]